MSYTSPFSRFSTGVWQIAHIDTLRCAMVCDVYLPFHRIL